MVGGSSDPVESLQAVKPRTVNDEGAARIMLSELKTAFLRGARGTLRYGYFAPLVAMWLFATRPGSYGRHLKALYKLAFWRGKLYP